MKLIKLKKWVQQRYKKRMDTIFMNSKNSKISDPHRLLLNLTDKISLERSDVKKL